MSRLLSRDRLIEEVRAALVAGRSVLLVGPAGVGKTAVLRAVCESTRVEVVDPFEHLSRLEAALVRRHLDSDGVYVGAARSLERRTLGAVGRILWRFDIVRVRPLSGPEIGRILRDALARARPGMALDDGWVRELERLSKGLPGRAVGLASAALAYWDRRRELPTPAWTLTEALVASVLGSRPDPGERRRRVR